MNIVNFILQLLHIRNLSTLSVLTAFCLPYTPSANYAHLTIDFKNTSAKLYRFFTKCAHNSKNCLNTLDDQTNIVTDSTSIPNKSSLDHYIPNFTLLQLLICKSKIKIVFTIGFVISQIIILHHFSFMVFVFYICHCPPLCQNSPPKLHLHFFPNILPSIVLFNEHQIPCIYKV
jgi:hypothetical protein